MTLEFDLLEIRQIATTYCSPDWQWNSARNQDAFRRCFLWLVVAGHGELFEGGRLHEVGMGDCLLMPASEEKRGRHDPENPLIVSWAELVFGRKREDRASAPGPLHVRLDRLGLLNDLFSRARNACRQDGFESDAGQLWMKCLLEELFRLARRPSLNAVSHHTEAIKALCEEIRLDPAQHNSIAEMAVKLHLSVDHFIRIFKQIRGVTPGEFVVNARIETAASLLLFTKRSVSEIADQLGYCDVFHFSKQFKVRMGVSPRAYRSGGDGRGMRQ